MRPFALTCLAVVALATPVAAQSKQTENTFKLDGEPGKAALAGVARLAGHWAADGLAVFVAIRQKDGKFDRGALQVQGGQASHVLRGEPD